MAVGALDDELDEVPLGRRDVTDGVRHQLGHEQLRVAHREVVDGPGQPGVPDGTDGLIGYIVDPRHAGRGIATATARALLAAAFDDLGLRRVTAAAYADNPASVAVLEKAGMRRERLSRQALWHHELGWIDEVGYAVLAEEWALR